MFESVFFHFAVFVIRFSVSFVCMYQHRLMFSVLFPFWQNNLLKIKTKAQMKAAARSEDYHSMKRKMKRNASTESELIPSENDL